MDDESHNDSLVSDSPAEARPQEQEFEDAPGHSRVWGGADRLGYRRRAVRLGARRPGRPLRAARPGDKVGPGARPGAVGPQGARLGSEELLDELAPRVWESVLWALSFSGMGQMYNGRWMRGLAAVLLPACLLVAAAWTHYPVLYLMAFWAGACTAPTALMLFGALVGWVPMFHPAIWMGLPMKAAVVLDAGYTAYRLRRAQEIPRRPRLARPLYAGALGVLLLVWMFSLGLVSVRDPDMSPVVEPGDHLVVDRLAFGLQIPLLGVRIGGRGLRRGDRVVVIDPKGSGRLLVRRVFAVAGDRVAFGPGSRAARAAGAASPGSISGMPAPAHRSVRSTRVGVARLLHPRLGPGGAAPRPVRWLPWPGPCVYALAQRDRRPGRNYVRCRSLVEVLGRVRYRVSYPRSGRGDASGRAPWEGKVPAGRVYLLSDNRAGSDSRVWGPVSERRIRGMPLAVIWSQDPLEGVRWHRMGSSLRDWP